MSELSAALTIGDVVDAIDLAERERRTDSYLRAIAIGVAVIAAELRGLTKATYNLRGV